MINERKRLLKDIQQKCPFLFERDQVNIFYILK